MKHLVHPALLAVFVATTASAQFQLVPDGSAAVTENGNSFNMPWAGGLNWCQISELDIDLDGDDDLFIFDKSGDKVVILENGGTPNTVDLLHTPDYDNVYPFNELHEWARIRDYNCDGSLSATPRRCVSGKRSWRSATPSGSTIR